MMSLSLEGKTIWEYNITNHSKFMNESLRVQIQENDSAQNCSPYLTPLIFQSFVEKLMDPTPQKTSKPGKKQAQADNK